MPEAVNMKKVKKDTDIVAPNSGRIDKSKKAPKSVAKSMPKKVSKAMAVGTPGKPCPKCKKVLPKSGVCNVCKSMDMGGMGNMDILSNNGGG
jgi:hypothetical protein